MSAVAQASLSPEEYLAMERQAQEKSEFVDGEMFLMAGATEEHNAISSNLVIELGIQFKKRPCKVYSSDMRVNVSIQGDYVYPDVVALCEAPQFSDEHKDNLMNPALVVEVLSESSEIYDRGRKFELYRQLPSVQEYLLVAQDRCHIEQYQRQANGQWLLSEFKAMEAELVLTSVNVTLRVEDVYDKVR